RVIKVAAVSGAARVTLRYIASQSGAAEWAIDVPNQSLGMVLSGLESGSTQVPADARAGMVTSVVIPDDPHTVPVANAQLILDRWPRPNWPEASALTGASGAISLRVAPDSAVGSFRVTRLEVAAALFALSGAGSLDFRSGLRLRAQARGSRSCQELAALLPASVYREKVRAYVGSHTKDERVELSLSIDLQDTAARENAEQTGLRFAWHLAAGCGLEELRPDPV
ncbi:MAG TPA: hypothetical protein VFQ61_24575, partial [Polyangiaceae bacterium]|nr:hypothetical protein [Polyangiaceae bacterium]